MIAWLRHSICHWFPGEPKWQSPLRYLILILLLLFSFYSDYDYWTLIVIVTITNARNVQCWNSFMWKVSRYIIQDISDTLTILKFSMFSFHYDLLPFDDASCTWLCVKTSTWRYSLQLTYVQCTYHSRRKYNSGTPVTIRSFFQCAVPARIIDHLSTQDVTVHENEHVTLVCNVTGVPQPVVTWYRHVADQKGVEKMSEFCPGTKPNDRKKF